MKVLGIGNVSCYNRAQAQVLRFNNPAFKGEAALDVYLQDRPDPAADKARLAELKDKVCAANIRLKDEKIIVDTWGNVSERDPETGLVVIKPSGVGYDAMKPEHMVVVDLNGKKVDGELNPSVDTPTHLALYRAYDKINAVAHTHSINATAFAQAGRQIPALGTTHADYFYGTIPVTRTLTTEEITQNYEANTGKVIIEAMEGKDPVRVPGVLVKNHGVFTLGKTADDSVKNAVFLETIADMALKTATLLNTPENPVEMPDNLLRFHNDRKHGPGAYYGQKSGSV